MNRARQYCFTLLLLLAASISAQDKVRGNYLRTEVRKQEAREQFDCQLGTGLASQPRLVFRRQKFVTLHEVRIFETLLRTALESDSSTGKTAFSYQYQVLPGEFMEGETLTRTETQDQGPFADTLFLINGKELRTDAQGEIVDSGPDCLGILEYFDKWENRQLEFTVEHSTLGVRKMTVYRIMPRRPKSDEKTLEESPANDILLSFNLDYEQRRTPPERENLQIEYLVSSSSIRPGSPFSLTVKISNLGLQDTSNLTGCIFSREPWLHGRMFYFGAIAPGKSLVFTRSFLPDQALAVPTCYATLAFIDSWGKLPAPPLQLEIPASYQ